MKKNNYLIFILMGIYLFFTMIFPFNYNIIYYSNIIFFIVFIIIFLKFKKYKFDKIDLLFALVPALYSLITILKQNYDIIEVNYCVILFDAVIILFLILYKRIEFKNKNNIILNIIKYLICIYFILSMISYIFDTNIFFGDMWKNSIDRFYGILLYPNASSCLFIIGFFICLLNLFKKENIIDSILLLIFSIGFSYCFSKATTIYFILLLIVLTIYLILLKKKKYIKIIIHQLISLFIPVNLSLYLFRSYMFNINIIKYIIGLFLIILLYLIIMNIFKYLLNKNFKISIFISMIVLGFYTIVIFNPINIPFKINSKIPTRNTLNGMTYITTFKLDNDDKEHNVLIDCNNYGKEVNFNITKLLIYKEEIADLDIVASSKENNISFKTSNDAIYYLISITSYENPINIKINHIYIDDKEKAINTLLVPYQINEMKYFMDDDISSVTTRFKFYKRSLKYLKDDYFIFGHGYNSFYKNKYNEVNSGSNSHNYLLNLWIEIGIYGLFYVCFIYIFGIYNMFKKKNSFEYTIWFLIFSMISLYSLTDSFVTEAILNLLFMLSFTIICEKDKKTLQ